MKNEENYAWVSNNEIHKAANLEMNEFLDRIYCIDNLRMKWQLSFTLYPTSRESVEMNLNLWDYVNTNRNALNEYDYIFRIGFPPALYQFLKHTKRTNIVNLIALGIAGRYIADPANRKILKDQIYKPILAKAKRIIKEFFADLKPEDPEWMADDSDGFTLLFWQRFEEYFNIAFREKVGNSVAFPLVDPMNVSLKSQFGHFPFNEFDIHLPYAFVTDHDWKRIVINEESDNLCRIEGSEEHWLGWLSEYVFKEESVLVGKYL